MICRIKSDFGIGKVEYRRGYIGEFSADQVARLPDLLEPMTGGNKPQGANGNGGRRQGTKPRGKQFDAPPADKMIRGGQTKTK